LKPEEFVFLKKEKKKEKKKIPISNLACFSIADRVQEENINLADLADLVRLDYNKSFI
jgi:hypothetical protein